MPKPVFSCFCIRTPELPHFERIADRFQTDSARFSHARPGRFGFIQNNEGLFFLNVWMESLPFGEGIGKYEAVLAYAEVSEGRYIESSSELAALARRLDVFDFLPDCEDDKDLAWRCIHEDIYLQLSSELSDFFDYEAYGKHAYTVTETHTAQGYTLLRDSIEIVITARERDAICEICGAALLTASATVNGNAVTMLENNGSVNAQVPLTVVNTKGPDLPVTGDDGVWKYGVISILLMTGSTIAIILVLKGKKEPKSKQ